MKGKTTSLWIIFGVFIVLVLAGGSLYLTGRHQNAKQRVSEAASSPSFEVNDNFSGAVSAPAKLSGSSPVPSPNPVRQPVVFGLSGLVRLTDVPEGRFRNELALLSESACENALAKLGRLRVPLNDVASLSVDQTGGLFYQCTPPRRPPDRSFMTFIRDEAQPWLPGGAPDKSVEEASVPIASPPIRHSRSGATKVIYLDFNGHAITGTAWNNQKGSVGDANYRPAVTSYVAKPFNTDGDPSSFSDAEQAAIVQVWERVVEDYRGFDVDVTTEEPAVFNANTGRILITDNVDANGVKMPSSATAGVAYLDVFGDSNYPSYYSPALVYANQNYNNEAYIAETASHEMGHNLSLSHDGTTTGDEYYKGQGGGETYWNTIMGGAYSENVTQWSKGEYYNANNQEDDLAIIAGHLGYGVDDHSDSNATAMPLTVSGLIVSGSGVISQTGDGDRFAFASGPGPIAITVSPFRSAIHSYGGNLDVALELYDSAGNLVTGTNPPGVTSATLNATVSGGTFYLKVYGAGNGTPLFGYSDYASLGWYTISGTVVSTTPVAPSITSQPTNQSVYVGQNAQFAFVGGGYPAVTFQWQRMPAGGGTWSNLSDSSTYSGTATATLNIVAASLVMNGDQFRCSLTNGEGSVTSVPAMLTVTSMAPPVISGLPTETATNYGNSLQLFTTVTGIAPISLQWKKDGVDLVGATNLYFSKYYLTPVDSGTYTLTATNGGGSVSASLTLVVLPAIPPRIIQPRSLTLLAGAVARFEVTAVEGTNPITYQWYRNGQILTGETNALLTIPSVQAPNTGNYTVVVTNPGGSITSETGSLSISPPAGTISVQTNKNYSSGKSVFVRSDGTLWLLGSAIPSPVLVSTGVTSASTAPYCSIFIKSDGSLWGIGENVYGQLGTAPLTNDTPVQIASGVVAASAGTAHVLFIKRDGTLWGLGQNSWGVLGAYTNDNGARQIATDVVAVAAGDRHSLFLKADGTLWGMGANFAGELGAGSLTNTSIPLQIASGVTGISASNYSLFSKVDGSLWGMGNNYNGQLGDTGAFAHNTPIQIANDAVFASAGAAHSLFIKADGSLWGMGDNYNGQLGSGALGLTIRNPIQIALGVITAAAGSGYSLFGKSDGSLWGSGYNNVGQLGDGTTTNRPNLILIASGQLTIPNPPVSVVVVDSILPNTTRITWNPTVAATSFEVWRSTMNNPATATCIAASVQISLYYDRTAIAGTTYHYWIKAVNPAGTSGFSSTVITPPNNAVISITIE